MINIRTKLSVALSFLQARFFKKKLPLLVGWSVTGRCNRDCLYCNVKTLGKELSAEEALKVIDQLAAAGTKLVQLTGGSRCSGRISGDLYDMRKAGTCW